MFKTLLINLDEVNEEKNKDVSLELVERALGRMGYYVFKRIDAPDVTLRDQLTINHIVECATVCIPSNARVLPKVISANLICLFFYY